jgi:hypothetical protein
MEDIEIRGACEIVDYNHHGREMILLVRPMIAAAQYHRTEGTPMDDAER